MSRPRYTIDVTDTSILSTSIGSVNDPLNEVLYHDISREYRRQATLIAVEESGFKVEVSGGVRMLIRSAQETPEWCEAVREALMASGQHPDNLNISGYLVGNRWLPVHEPEAWAVRWDRALREFQAKQVIDS